MPIRDGAIAAESLPLQYAGFTAFFESFGSPRHGRLAPCSVEFAPIVETKSNDRWRGTVQAGPVPARMGTSAPGALEQAIVQFWYRPVVPRSRVSLMVVIDCGPRGTSAKVPDGILNASIAEKTAIMISVTGSARGLLEAASTLGR